MNKEEFKAFRKDIRYEIKFMEDEHYFQGNSHISEALERFRRLWFEYDDIGYDFFVSDPGRFARHMRRLKSIIGVGDFLIKMIERVVHPVWRRHLALQTVLIMRNHTCVGKDIAVMIAKMVFKDWVPFESESNRCAPVWREAMEEALNLKRRKTKNISQK